MSDPQTIAHASDCATHNAPAELSGPCDCGATLPQVRVENVGVVQDLRWAPHAFVNLADLAAFVDARLARRDGGSASSDSVSGASTTPQAQARGAAEPAADVHGDCIALAAWLERNHYFPNPSPRKSATEIGPSQMLDLAALVARLESAARALDDACAGECPVHLLSEMTELHEAIAALDEARSRGARERRGWMTIQIEFSARMIEEVIQQWLRENPGKTDRDMPSGVFAAVIEDIRALAPAGPEAPELATYKRVRERMLVVSPAAWVDLEDWLDAEIARITAPRQGETA